MKKHFFILLLLLPCLSNAKGIYQKPNDFISEAFNRQPPKPSVIWLKGSLREQIGDILQHKLKVLRLRYWYQGDRSAWVINEIGKEKNITIGVIVKNGKLEKVKTLIFRESRGWEISEDFFTQQFIGGELSPNLQLNQSIDSITGATLSVRAVEKASRIALLLHNKISSRKTKQ